MIQLKIKRTKVIVILSQSLERIEIPLFCMGIDDGGVEVCTSAKINVINRTFIHILVISLKTPSVECCRRAAE